MHDWFLAAGPRAEGTIWGVRIREHLLSELRPLEGELRIAETKAAPGSRMSKSSYALPVGTGADSLNWTQDGWGKRCDRQTARLAPGRFAKPVGVADDEGIP